MPKIVRMKVFKFGGASVKDAAAVRNVASILQLFEGQKLAIVISAMGKTTNAMENIAKAHWNRNAEEFSNLVDERQHFHLDIMNDLFEDASAPIFGEIEGVFAGLRNNFDGIVSENFDFEYDQIVSLGEVISTKIISAYLSSQGVACQWADARMLIATDRKFREAEIDWDLTTTHFEKRFLPNFD